MKNRFDNEKNDISFTLKVGVALLHLPICVLGNLQWEIPGAYEKSPRTIIGGKKMKKSSTGLKSLLFFFDSVLRVISSMFCIKRNIFTELPIYTHFKIFTVRTVGAVGNVVQSVGMVLCGGDVFAVMRQARIPIVAMLRYSTLHDVLTLQEINYLWITMCAALSFVLCKDLGADDFGFGMILLIIALLMRSVYYVLTEVFLKKELSKFSVTEKQTLVGTHDLVGYFFVVWLEILIEQRNWNPLHGFFNNYSMSMCVMVNFAQNWLGIVITLWFDSMLLQLLNVAATGLTWLAKLTYQPEEWKPIKVPILLILLSATLAYTVKNNCRKSGKKNST